VNDRYRPYYGGNDGNNHNKRRHEHHDHRHDQQSPWRGEKRPGPPESTNREVEYIKSLIENHTPVTVRLDDNSEVSGVIEYYDKSFIRLTREAQPNLLIFKDKIKYLYEG
jgi:hypothetical protein